MEVIVELFGESVWNGLDGVVGQSDVKDLADCSGIFSSFDTSIVSLDGVRMHYSL